MFLSAEDYAWMEAMQVDTMLDVAVRVSSSITEDAAGQQVTTYTDAEQFPCGFLGDKYSEVFSQAGQYMRFDALVRVPREKWVLFGAEDRVKVLFRGEVATAKVFEIVGPVYPGKSATLIGLRMA